MDRLKNMRTFCRVAELNSFSQTARQLEITPAMVSRQVSDLESHLGIRLLNRSTRHVELSEAGVRYYPRCLELIEQLQVLESEVNGMGARPSGRLRVSAPMDFGQLYLRPALREFLSVYPDVNMVLHLEDRLVHLIEEQVDVAIRIAHQKDSSLVARTLGQACIACYASPDYLAQHDEPTHPDDLRQHDVLQYAHADASDRWTFAEQGREVEVPVTWRLAVNNGRALADAATRGLGVVRLPEFLVQDHLQSGALLEILKPFRSTPVDITALYLHRKFKPAKIRVFIDFLDDWFEQHGLCPALDSRHLIPGT
jgi:DNA-binding transcriptional LysR family regulator